jgi:hypothetical protein
MGLVKRHFLLAGKKWLVGIQFHETANYRIILSFRRKLDDFERLQYQLWSRFVGVASGLRVQT